jgi:predicted peptidase
MEKMIAALCCAFLLTGCGNVSEMSGEEIDRRDPTLVPALTTEAVKATALARWPTGVQLQNSLDLTAGIDGTPASHERMNYLLYLPEGFHQEPDQLWPLIVFLHGAGDQDNDSAFVMSFGLPGALHLGEHPEDFPFVVVSPQAFPNTPWWSGDTLIVLNALLDQVVSEYRIDESRVYLTGLSMGGYGSWFFASMYPERFAAMVSVSGSGYRMPIPPDPELICRLSTVPVWGIHGEKDGISAPDASEFHIRMLESVCEGDARWTLYAGEGHLGAYERAYRDPELYRWLLKQSK